LARADWGRANLAIEEFLRFLSPVQFSKPRVVRHDMELGGVALKRGDRIMAMLAAANMDPAANEHPERLDLARHPNRHLAFGTGHPFLLGPSARAQSRAVRADGLFKRWPKLELAVPDSQIRWRERRPQALATLPVMARQQ
jgi:cytochrome P450 PksS